MADHDASVVFSIEADPSSARQSIHQFTREVENAGREWENATDDAAEGMTRSISKALDINRLKDWALQAGKAMLNFGMECVSAASDLQEVQNVVDVTFEGAAETINQWAKAAGQQFGLTEKQAKNFTSTLGAMAKSAGLAGPEIVEMSTDLAGLAADMASFYNMDFETAFQKIRSGISGEVEPLRQLGINMSVANLQAYALTQGISTAFDKMSQSEQMMLRYQYLMSVTADAQGDFARTSDGYANSVRQLETNWESLKTNIGTAVLPFVNDAINGLNSLFSSLFPTEVPHRTLADKIGDIEKEAATKIADIEYTSGKARALIEELSRMQSIGEGITLKTNLRDFISALEKDFGDMQSAIDRAEEADFGGSLAAISQKVADSTGIDATRWNLLFDAISGKLRSATNATLDDNGQLAAWMEAAAEAADDLGGDYSDMWASFLQTLGEDAGAAVQAFANASTSAENLKKFAENANTLRQDTSGKWGNLSESLNGFIESIAANGYVTTLQDLSNALSEATGVETSEWETLLTTIAGDLKEAKSAIDENGEPVKSFFQTAKEAASGLGEEAYSRWSDLFGALGEKGPAFLEALADSDAVANLGTLATNANSLDSSASGNWDNLKNSLNKLAEEAQQSGVSTKLNDVAEALGKATGLSSEPWETLLGKVAETLKNNGSDIGTYGDSVGSFLWYVAGAADELGGEYADIWGNFLETIGNNAPGVVEALKDSFDSAMNLGRFAEKAKILPSEAGGNWQNLLSSLANTTNLTEFGSKAGEAGNKISDFAQKLDSADNKEKIQAFNELVGYLKENAESLVSVTGLENAEQVESWLSGIADAANTLDPESSNGWQSIFNLFSQGLPGLETEGEEPSTVLSQLFGENAGESTKILAQISEGYSDAARQEQYWLTVCRELTKTIPGLSSIINQQTGEVKGGVDALMDYVDQWEQVNKQSVLLDSIAKQRQMVIEQSNSDQYRINTLYAQYERNKAEEALKQIEGLYEAVQRMREGRGQSGYNYVDSNDYDLITANKDAVERYIKALNDLEKKQAEEEQAAKELAEVLGMLAEQSQAVMEGTNNASTDNGFVEWTEQMKTAAKELLPVLESDLKAIADYVENVRSSINSSVNGTVNGFNAISSSVVSTKQKILELKDEVDAIEDKSSAKYKEVEEEYQDYLNGNKSLADDMKNNLQDQLNFMNRYLADLEAAKDKGFSGDLLSELANGTAESAAYLSELVDSDNSEIAKEINELYSQVNSKKEQLAQTLSDQQLSVDEVYQNMVKIAQDAVEQLDMGDEAGANAGKTAESIVRALNDHVDDVSTAVNNILEILNRLNNYKVNIDVGVSGGYSGGGGISRSGGVKVTPLAIGMDYVPYDGFLAALHEGEGVLTAEENRMWQRFRAGGAETRNTLDYDTLGNVMKDSVRPGGNVYLDGRTVGKVISDIQGQQYRQLQRSGWQA